MDAQPADRSLRTTFDDVAELYDRVRPTYPAEVFDDLVALATLRPGARVVEIGCGTGQATIPLAERGLRVTCVELGPRLAAVARVRSAAFASVDVVTAAFEAWQPAAGDYDAVVAFTAFHWLDPEVRWDRCAAVLRPAGALAIVTTQHVLPPDGDPFFAAVQQDYAALLPGTTEQPPPRPEDVPGLAAEIEAGGRFRSVAERRHVWDVTYDADHYIAVLDTYSAKRALDETTRRRLYARIRRRIARQPGGRVRKSYLAILDVACRR